MIQIGQTPASMAWGTLGTVGFRVLFVWLYNNTGKSVFACILVHAIANTSRSVFPGGRSAYELAGGTIGYSLTTITVVIVVFLWGAETLTRLRYARRAAPIPD
jgi:hypothetical protein